LQSLYHAVWAFGHDSAVTLLSSSDTPALGPVYQNVTSSTKPEVHNIAAPPEEDEPPQWTTCTENLGVIMVPES